MRVTIEVPDRVAQDALREYRTVRQQAEYLISRAIDEQAPRRVANPACQPAEARR